MEIQREFNFTQKDFDYIRKLVKHKSGIELSDTKYNMVYSRLTRRLRALGLEDFATYCQVLKNEDQNEIVNFTNAITTNLTFFFREQHHFDYLSRVLIPQWSKQYQQKRRIRIWSAGCSTGEEPYSIALTLLEHLPNLHDWDVKILATDLDTNVLEHASTGIYNLDRVSDMPQPLLKKWFLKRKRDITREIKVRRELRELITFKQLNLLKDWPFTGCFDLIYCRNVMIYFNKDTQRQLVERFANSLSDNACIFLGHAESLFKVSDRFHLLKNTMYRKVG